MSGRIEIDYDDGQLHNSVEAAGEFTSWVPVLLGHAEGTKYSAVFDGAEAHAKYQFKFVVDGNWTLLSGYETADDGVGNINHTVIASTVQSEPQPTTWAASDKQPTTDANGIVSTPKELSAAPELGETSAASNSIPVITQSQEVYAKKEGDEGWSKVAESGTYVVSAGDSYDNAPHVPEDPANSTFGTAYTTEQSWAGPGDPALESETSVYNSATDGSGEPLEAPAPEPATLVNSQSDRTLSKGTELETPSTQPASAVSATAQDTPIPTSTPLPTDTQATTVSPVPVDLNNASKEVKKDAPQSPVKPGAEQRRFSFQSLRSGESTKRRSQQVSVPPITPSVDNKNPAAAAAARASTYAKADVASLQQPQGASSEAKDSSKLYGKVDGRTSATGTVSSDARAYGNSDTTTQPVQKAAKETATTQKRGGRFRRFLKKLVD